MGQTIRDLDRRQALHLSPPASTLTGRWAMRRFLLALVLALYSLPVLADQNGQGQDGQGNGTEVLGIAARVVAVHTPGASALAQVGTFLNVPPPGACANPIPSKFPSYIQPGAVLDPNRILVGIL